MCCLSANKNNHIVKSTSITANHIQRTPTAFCNHVGGFRGKIAGVKRKWHHPHHHWPRMHQGGYLSALPWKYGSRSHCRTIQGAGFSLYWDPYVAYLWSRHKVHFIMVQRDVSHVRSHTKSKYGLPPTNWWTIRKNESDDGRTTENLL